MDNMSAETKIGILLMGAGIGLIAGTGLQFSMMTAFIVGGVWILSGVFLSNGK